MAFVRDRWTDQNPDGPDARPRRVHNARWGRGKRWQAVWGDATGRQCLKACSAKDEAEKIIRDRDGKKAAARPVPLDEWVHQWEKSQLHWSAGTADNAHRAIERTILPSFKGATVQSLTRQTVQDAVADWSRRWAPTTIAVRWAYIAAPMAQAVRDGLIDRSPCDDVRLPAVGPGKLHVLTRDQVLVVAGRMPRRDRATVLLGAATGVRPAELWGITWDRVDGGVITVDRQLRRRCGATPAWGPVKTPRSNRRVTVGPAVVKMLTAHREAFGVGPGGLLWRSASGGCPSDSTLAREWGRAVDGMGLWARSGFHDLRHFHASALIAAGMSPRAVADRLGHADVSVTLNVYAHLWPSDEGRMAAVGDEIADSLSGRTVSRHQGNGAG